MNINPPNCLHPVPVNAHSSNVQMNSHADEVRHLPLMDRQHRKMEENYQSFTQPKINIRHVSTHDNIPPDNFLILMPDTFYPDRDRFRMQLSNNFQENIFRSTPERFMDILKVNQIPPDDHYSTNSERKSTKMRFAEQGESVSGFEADVSDEESEGSESLPFYPWMRSYYSGMKMIIKIIKQKYKMPISEFILAQRSI